MDIGYYTYVCSYICHTYIRYVKPTCSCGADGSTLLYLTTGRGFESSPTKSSIFSTIRWLRKLINNTYILYVWDTSRKVLMTILFPNITANLTNAVYRDSKYFIVLYEKHGYKRDRCVLQWLRDQHTLYFRITCSAFCVSLLPSPFQL